MVNARPLQNQPDAVANIAFQIKATPIAGNTTLTIALIANMGDVRLPLNQPENNVKDVFLKEGIIIAISMIEFN